MFDLLPLEQVASWPVYVSLAEARAYATWRGKRLPAEAEFHRAAYYGPDGLESSILGAKPIPRAARQFRFCRVVAGARRLTSRGC